MLQTRIGRPAQLYHLLEILDCYKFIKRVLLSGWFFQNTVLHSNTHPFTSVPAPGRKFLTVMVLPGAGKGASMMPLINGCTRAGEMALLFSTSSRIWKTRTMMFNFNITNPYECTLCILWCGICMMCYLIFITQFKHNHSNLSELVFIFCISI